MDAIGELIGTILMFLLECLILLIEIIASLFSSHRRRRLCEKWRNSKLVKIELLLSILLLIAIISGAIFVALKFSGCSTKPEPEVSPLEHSDGETHEIQINLNGKAIDYLKEKWKNRQKE